MLAFNCFIVWFKKFFSPHFVCVCFLGLWDKSTRCCPVCMKTKPLISWSGPEDVKEMIAAPELQSEFHYPQWVHRHTDVMNTDCVYACVHTFSCTLVILIYLCEQGHWHPILIRHWFRWSWWEECCHREREGMSGLWYFWLSERIYKISQCSFKWPFTPLSWKWFWS